MPEYKNKITYAVQEARIVTQGSNLLLPATKFKRARIGGSQHKCGIENCQSACSSNVLDTQGEMGTPGRSQQERDEHGRLNWCLTQY